MEQRMQTRMTYFALVAATFISLLALSAYGAGVGADNPAGSGYAGTPSADAVNAQNSGSAGVRSAPGDSSTTATGTGLNGSQGITTDAGTGLNTGNVNQSGVPNTSAPGHIGSGASPSGLPGDNPVAPGYPGRVVN
jgi:hypothetical protein